MSQKQVFDFIVNKEAHSITVNKVFSAERSLVWDAYTKSEMLEQWWAPKPWNAKTKTMEFREGGHWHYAMVGPTGEEHWGMTNYKVIRPKDYFMGFDGFADADGNINKEMPLSTWEINFSDSDGGTLVQYLVKYDDLAQLETTIKMGFKEGFTAALEGLEELLRNLKQ